ncbi:TPA: hypothetical protein ENX78_14635 [Candidatus Poribacteria bacterium]|nr:hypothetical protein [Candidatus Poribacteria bacterium]
MTEYYLDIETCIEGDRPDPLKDRIITIQYQRLDDCRGENGKLEILTEWDEGSEKSMLEKFRDIFITNNHFDFIPIGVNLYGYDLIVILKRFKAHGILDIDPFAFFRDRPVIDIKPILVLINRGSFRGYTDIIKKEHGTKIKEWYNNRNYEKIIEYITQEAQSIIKAYQILKEDLPEFSKKI